MILQHVYLGYYDGDDGYTLRMSRGLGGMRHLLEELSSGAPGEQKSFIYYPIVTESLFVLGQSTRITENNRPAYIQHNLILDAESFGLLMPDSETYLRAIEFYTTLESVPSFIESITMPSVSDVRPYILPRLNWDVITDDLFSGQTCNWVFSHSYADAETIARMVLARIFAVMPFEFVKRMPGVCTCAGSNLPSKLSMRFYLRPQTESLHLHVIDSINQLPQNTHYTVNHISSMLSSEMTEAMPRPLSDILSVRADDLYNLPLIKDLLAFFAAAQEYDFDQMTASYTELRRNGIYSNCRSTLENYILAMLKDHRDNPHIDQILNKLQNETPETYTKLHKRWGVEPSSPLVNSVKQPEETTTPFIVPETDTATSESLWKGGDTISGENQPVNQHVANDKRVGAQGIIRRADYDPELAEYNAFRFSGAQESSAAPDMRNEPGKTAFSSSKTYSSVRAGIPQPLRQPIGLEQRAPSPAQNLFEQQPPSPTQNLSKQQPPSPAQNLSKQQPPSPTQNLFEQQPTSPTQNLFEQQPPLPAQNLFEQQATLPTQNLFEQQPTSPAQIWNTSQMSAYAAQDTKPTHRFADLQTSAPPSMGYEYSMPPTTGPTDTSLRRAENPFAISIKFQLERDLILTTELETLNDLMIFYASNTNIDPKLLSRMAEHRREIIHKRKLAESSSANKRTKGGHFLDLFRKTNKQEAEPEATSSAKVPKGSEYDDADEYEKEYDNEYKKEYANGYEKKNSYDHHEEGGSSVNKTIPNVFTIVLIAIILMSLAVLFENEMRRGIAIIAGIFSQQLQGAIGSSPSQRNGNMANQGSTGNGQSRNEGEVAQSPSEASRLMVDDDTDVANVPTSSELTTIKYDPDNMPPPTDIDGDGEIDPPPTDLDGDGWIDSPNR
ncbi:MAG: hypothetical protein LBL96_02600 [Clostridiales bacterium]|nr:hypothetical protein [Clostridiales bacterium]